MAKNKPQKSDEIRCVKCGKVIKPEDKFTHQGQIYCCSDCCKIKETPGVCEFC